MIAVIPYLYALVSNYRLFLTASSIASFVSSGGVKNAVESFHKSIDSNRLDKVSNAETLKQTTASAAPINDDTVSIGINPVTLPDYMSIQSDMTLALTEQMRNISKQLEHQNNISTENMKIKAESEAHLESIAQTLNSALPALVVQVQELTKIPGIMSMSSEIDVAYRELGLQNHDALIATLSTMSIAVDAVPVTVSVPDQSLAIQELSFATTAQTAELVSINEKLVSVSANAVSQKAVADQQTSVGVITDLDGNILASTHSALQLEAMKNASAVNSNIKNTTAIKSMSDATVANVTELQGIKDNLVNVSDNAIKQKEIADYQTTAQPLVNLDGNVVATMKPIEAVTAKNITDAKNATDEMEFDIPDDVIDEIMGVIPLPPYTTQSIYDTDSEIYNSWSANV